MIPKILIDEAHEKILNFYDRNIEIFKNFEKDSELKIKENEIQLSEPFFKILFYFDQYDNLHFCLYKHCKILTSKRIEEKIFNFLDLSSFLTSFYKLEIRKFSFEISITYNKNERPIFLTCQETQGVYM